MKPTEGLGASLIGTIALATWVNQTYYYYGNKICDTFSESGEFFAACTAAVKSESPNMIAVFLVSFLTSTLVVVIILHKGNQ